MESKEKPKFSKIIACKFTGSGVIAGNETFWHDLEMENGDKGKCGVQAINRPLMQVGQEMHYQHIVNSRTPEGIPNSYKIKYLTPSSAEYKLKHEHGIDPVNQPAPGAPSDHSQDLFSSSVSTGKPGQSKPKPPKSNNQGATLPDGRKYSYAKHKDDFLGYAFSYAKDIVVARMQIDKTKTLKNNVEDINRVARYLFSNIEDMLLETDKEADLSQFHNPEDINPVEPKENPKVARKRGPRKK